MDKNQGYEIIKAVMLENGRGCLLYTSILHKEALRLSLLITAKK